MASPLPEAGPDHFGRMLQEARAGSREALGQLLGPFFFVLRARAERQMRAALRMKCGGSDLAQMTLLKAQAAFPTFRGNTPEELAAWLWGILRHNQQNFYRQHLGSQKRRVGREVPLDDGRASRRLRAKLEVRDAPAAEAAARREQDELIRRAVERLPLLPRRVVGLHGFGGLPFLEVGAALGCSEEAARKTFSRALRRLRRELCSERRKPT